MLYKTNLPSTYCCSLVLCSRIHVRLGLKSTTLLTKNGVGKAFEKLYDILRSVLGKYVHVGSFVLISLVVCFDVSLNTSSALTAAFCLLPAEVCVRNASFWRWHSLPCFRGCVWRDSSYICILQSSISCFLMKNVCEIGNRTQIEKKKKKNNSLIPLLSSIMKIKISMGILHSMDKG